MKVKAENQRRLRLDVTSTIGTHLASFLLIGDKLEYIIVDEKAYYKTTAHRGALKSVLDMPLDPRVLYNVFFDIPVEQKGWSCEVNDKGYVKACRELRTKLSISWIYRKGIERTIEIDHPTATVQMNLYSFTQELDEPEKAFALKVPGSFKTVRLR